MIRIAFGRAGLLLAVFAASSCAGSTPRSTAAGNVRVTRDEADVLGCRSLRLVEARTQFGRADSEKNLPEIMSEMKRETAILGGDALFLRPGPKISGVAYACGSVPAARS